MKRYGKVLLFIVTVVLILSLTSTICLADAGLDNFKKDEVYTPGRFTDVSNSAWYAGSVKEAYEYGLVKGDSETTFNPTGNLTIAEALTLASRLHSIYYNGAADFVISMPWYQAFVDYTESNGIIRSGEYANKYNEVATRAQFAMIFASAFPDEALQKINNVETGSLPDVKGNEVYGPAVYKLYNAGILLGNDYYGTFYPNSNIQRSEVAAIVTRMANTSLRKAFTPHMSPEVLLAIISRSDDVLDYLNNAMDCFSGCLSSIANGSHTIALAKSALASGQLGGAIEACGNDPYFMAIADRIRLVRSKLQQLSVYSTGSNEVSQKIVDIIKECMPILKTLYKEINGESYMLIDDAEGDLTYLSLSTGNLVVNP